MDEAVDQLQADYDTSPYESHAFPQSAPHLAAVAHLFGLDVPDGRAVGVDLSPVQINEGRQRIEALGLTNVELIRADIAQTDLAALGQFDDVICHGVYSWVRAA